MKARVNIGQFGAILNLDAQVSDAAFAFTLAVTDDSVIETALRILAQRLVHSTPLSSPRITRDYLVMRFAGLESFVK